MLGGSGSDARDGVGELFGAEFARHTERYRKVEMADPEAVDAGQRRDRVGVFHALRRLDLAEQSAALVGRRELLGDRARPIAVMRDLKGDAAATFGCVFHGVQNVTRFGNRADHRQHQAFRAHVHGPGNVVIFLRRRADDDWQVGRLKIADGALHRLEAEARMFEIEEHEVASG